MGRIDEDAAERVPRPVSRRTVLDWLGSSAVLSLAACGHDELLRPGEGATDAASTGGTTAGGASGYALGGSSSGTGAARNAAGAGGRGGDGGGGAGRGGAGSAGPVVAFSPGPEPTALVGDWRERTVDPQDLVKLLTSWQLVVDGMVENPIVLSFAELLALPRQDQITDFHCVEGWSVYDVPWNGVHLTQLLGLVTPLSGATHLTFHCFGDRYDESLPWSVALEPRTMLAYGVGGNTLPVAHGFPLRVVVPRLFGYKNAKHVQRIEVTDAAVEGYWVRRGYSYEAEVQASRLREGRY